MSLSPLKFSLGVSVLVHGLVIGGAVWLGQQRQTVPIATGATTTTLELIAAPANAAEQLVETIITSRPAAPNPAPPPPEEIVPVKTIEPLPMEEAILPPPPPVETATKPVAVAMPVVPTASVGEPAAPGNIRGDNSSPLPGKDFTTVASRAMTLARPSVLANLEPEYPLAARRRGQEGTVIVSVTVSPTGAAAEVVVVKSSGYELLDEAAVKFARTWEFTPARLGSTPVESKIERPIRFKLTR